MSVIERCPYYRVVRKERLDCNLKCDQGFHCILTLRCQIMKLLRVRCLEFELLGESFLL